MKRIFLFIAASLVFLVARAQITQSASDSIALQRMSKETRQYTLFAQKNLQTDFTITTSEGEVLELDYPSWIYYVNYIEETDNHVCRYLIVKESDGNLLEVKTKKAIIPDDLAEWKVLKWITIPFTEYLLDSASCQWTNVEPDTVIIINSNNELEDYITCAGGNYPAIDFDQHSLLLAHGNTIYGSIANISQSLSMLSLDNYKLTIEIQLQDTVATQQWYTAIIVPKLPQNTAVHLNIYYPHLSVWKCFFDTSTSMSPVYHPDITIILTMDSLLSKYYVSSSPQDLEPYRIFVLFDGLEGEYSIQGDTGYFYDFIPHLIFLQTMLSPDKMLLQLTNFASYFPAITDYLFIKQNYNY
jgi:hypothetical protein